MHLWPWPLTFWHWRVSIIGKKLLNSNDSPRCPHNMADFGLLTAEIGLPVWDTQQILTDFAPWLRYFSDIAHRRPTKLCTIFGRLLGWYSQTLRRGTRNGIMELSQRAQPIFGWAAITLGIGPHSSCNISWQKWVAYNMFSLMLQLHSKGVVPC